MHCQAIQQICGRDRPGVPHSKIGAFQESSPYLKPRSTLERTTYMPITITKIPAV